MDETYDSGPMPWPPERSGFEKHRWGQLLSCSVDAAAALDVRLRGAHGLSLRDVLVLDMLTTPDRRAHRIHALARMLWVSPSCLANQLRRLEKRGLVTRSPSRSDPRGVLPRLTGEGQVRLHEVLEVYALRCTRGGAINSSTSK